MADPDAGGTAFPKSLCCSRYPASPIAVQQSHSPNHPARQNARTHRMAWSPFSASECSYLPLARHGSSPIPWAQDAVADLVRHCSNLQKPRLDISSRGFATALTHRAPPKETCMARDSRLALSRSGPTGAMPSPANQPSGRPDERLQSPAPARTGIGRASTCARSRMPPELHRMPVGARGFAGHILARPLN